MHRISFAILPFALSRAAGADRYEAELAMVDSNTVQKTADANASGGFYMNMKDGKASDAADWYPGDAYVDIVGRDYYYYPRIANHGSLVASFEKVKDLFGGTKLIALSENGSRDRYTADLRRGPGSDAEDPATTLGDGETVTARVALSAW